MNPELSTGNGGRLETAYKTIVIAKMVDRRLWNGRSLRGKRPQACVWLNRGDITDLLNAQTYAALEGYTVFVYDLDEPDPLGRAKREIQDEQNALERDRSI